MQAKYLVNLFEMLPLEARDGVFDVLEKALKTEQAKAKRPVVAAGCGMIYSGLQLARLATATPDDDKDQLNPV